MMMMMIIIRINREKKKNKFNFFYCEIEEKKIFFLFGTRTFFLLDFSVKKKFVVFSFFPFIHFSSVCLHVYYLCLKMENDNGAGNTHTRKKGLSETSKKKKNKFGTMKWKWNEHQVYLFFVFFLLLFFIIRRGDMINYINTTAIAIAATPTP